MEKGWKGVGGRPEKVWRKAEGLAEGWRLAEETPEKGWKKAGGKLDEI